MKHFFFTRTLQDKKLKTVSVLSFEGPLRHGWVTGLREDVPRQCMWKGRKGPKPDFIRVDYIAIFQSSQALGFSLPKRSDGSFMCVWGGGFKKKRQRWVGSLTPDNEKFSSNDTNTFFVPLSHVFLVSYRTPHWLTHLFFFFFFAHTESSTSSSCCSGCATGCKPRKLEVLCTSVGLL